MSRPRPPVSIELMIQFTAVAQVAKLQGMTVADAARLLRWLYARVPPCVSPQPSGTVMPVGDSLVP